MSYTIIVMEKLFNDIYSIYEIAGDWKIGKYNGNKNLLGKNRFMSRGIYNDIKKNYKNTYVIEDRDIGNKIWITMKGNKLDKDFTEKLVNRIRCIKKYCGNYDENKIYLWLTDNKKMLPGSGKLDIENVNSGTSIVYHPKVRINGDIYIWRKEEILKVLIHELLHSLRCDYYSQNVDLDKFISRIFNVDNHINVNECYTETLATILNCIFYAIENNKDYEYCMALILNEINHSKRQVKKILKYNGYNSFNELYRRWGNKKFMQNTSVFSYYILKSVLLNNLIDFIKFIDGRCLKYPYGGNKKFCKLLMKSLDKYFLIYDNDQYNDKRLCMTITSYKNL